MYQRSYGVGEWDPGEKEKAVPVFWWRLAGRGTDLGKKGLLGIHAAASDPGNRGWKGLPWLVGAEVCVRSGGRMQTGGGWS